MKHLNDADRAFLARQLESMRQQALAELRDEAPDVLASNRLDVTQEVHTQSEDAEAEREDEVRQAEIEVDRHRLSDIEQAQRRLAEGRYGICTACGADIALARLQAQPIAIRCATCQARYEEGQRPR